MSTPSIGKALVVRPPAPLPAPKGRPAIFLAGSIDNGEAIDWQGEMIAALAADDVVILNPRRETWPSDQNTESALFREQVQWELDGLERADIVAVYLAPGSLAPISLLELGLHAQSGKIILCCPSGFWRKGNVDFVAERYAIETVASVGALVDAIRERTRR